MLESSASSSVSSLVLWRYAIHLAHKTVKPSWEGPFFKAGYRSFLLEARHYNLRGAGYTPDITLVGEDDWVVLELTVNPASKKPKIEFYRTLSPDFLKPDHALSTPRGNRPPIPIVMRTNAGVPDGCAQIVVAEVVALHGMEQVTDAVLRSELLRLDGTSLTPIPQVRIAFVPDSNQREVRQGLAASIKSLLTTPGRKLDAHSLAEEGLDFLWSHTSEEGRRRLIDKIHEAMNDLVKPEGGPLSEYVSTDETGYSCKGPVPPHPRSMERIEQLLDDWIERAKPGRQAKMSEYAASAQGPQANR